MNEVGGRGKSISRRSRSTIVNIPHIVRSDTWFVDNKTLLVKREKHIIFPNFGFGLESLEFLFQIQFAFYQLFWQEKREAHARRRDVNAFPINNLRQINLQLNCGRLLSKATRIVSLSGFW